MNNWSNNWSNNRSNNILSYFIKDIKDAKERAFYKQVNYNTHIKVFYKDLLLYERTRYWCCNFLHNYEKNYPLNLLFNLKIKYNLKNNEKNLFYKEDVKIGYYNPNFITIYFYFDKYLKKEHFDFFNNNEHLLTTKIKYYTQYKYIYIYSKFLLSKFTSPIVLIPNKYELNYYCKFFNLYLANNY
jgi:hypothetical protein